MLGKLIKYEFKNTSKTMLLTYAALAVFTIMGSLALRYLNERPFHNTFFNAISKGLLALYVIAIIAIYCMNFIYLCSHYHKTMYSAQGYLTHTLPVSPAAIFSVKIFSFFIWIVASTFLSVLSFLCFVWIGSDPVAFRTVSFFSKSQRIESLFGTSAGYIIFSVFMEAFLGILLSILWIAASMAIGQLFQKNRTGFSILAAVCLYIASQTVNTLFLAIAGYQGGYAFYALSISRRRFVETITGGTMAINTVLILILYGICLYINKKRLNLE